MLSLVKDFDIIHLESVDSTNNYAKKIISESDKKNFIIIADTQTSGRTTKKEKWISPKGNLYITFAIQLENNEEKYFPMFSFLSALSIIQSVESVADFKMDLKIKWPNDVLLEYKKLSGILIEKESNFAIIGIGVNVNSSPDNSLTKYPTTSLLESKINVSVEKFALELQKNIINNINICRENGFEKMIELVKPFMCKIGEYVYVMTPNNNLVCGIFSGLSVDGGLIIKTSEGTKTLMSGELTKENFV